MKITKDMIIGDLLQQDPNMASILQASGMHCVGCPSSQGETLEEAAAVHGMEADTLIARINTFREVMNK